MITKLTKHDSHPIRIHLTKGQGPHFAALRCVKCNVHIQWLSVTDCQRLSDLGVSIHQQGYKNGKETLQT